MVNTYYNVRRIRNISLMLPCILCAAAVLAAILPAFGLEPESAAALLGRDIYTEIRASGKMIRLSSSGQPSLLPAHAVSQAIREEIESAKPGILVEAVFVLPRPAAANREESAAELASIYGLLRSIHSLEGIQYYSASRKTMRVFYAESYRIDGPNGKAAMADPPYPSILEPSQRETIFAFQRDLTFGGNRYKYLFENMGDAVAVKVVNLSRMYYGILPVLSPGNLTTRIVVAPVSDGIVFYAASWAQAPGLLKNKLQNSFGNRAEALFHWFEQKSQPFIKRDGK